ncbi:MAG: hypothetical protein KDE28_26170, partial [Anaerolineales bacterium]|nr:hypothetical protein [Anaerolineales bacterium]
MQMRSLAIKLTFAFLLISILGTATVALLVNWQTRRQFDDLVNELYLEDLQTAQERLATIYASKGSWQGVENSFYGEQTIGTAPDGRPPRRLPITLVNSERLVIIGNHHLQPGEILPAAIVEQGLPIEVDGATVGWVMLDSF